MFRSAVFAILYLAAAPAFAQDQDVRVQSSPAARPPAAPAARTPAGPLPEAMAAVERTSTAFGQCVEPAIGGLPATVTPDDGADRVLATCSTQLQALERATNALIAVLPEAQREGAQAEVAARMATIPGEVASKIRAARGIPEPAPADAR